MQTEQGKVDYQTHVLHRKKPLGESLSEFARAGGPSAVFLTFAVLVPFLPGLYWLGLPAAIGVLLIAGFTRPKAPPISLPWYSSRKDPNNLDPATDKPTDAQGEHFLGNTLDDDREVWNTSDQDRAHFLILGTTGAGKTENILGMAYNSLLQAGGFILVDGKAESGLALRVSSMARRLGRDDDVFTLSFLTGNQDVRFRSTEQNSAKFNPLVHGSSSTIAELLKSMMESTGGQSGDSWRKLAEQFLDSIIRPLVFLRDAAGTPLTVKRVRDALDLNGVADLFREIEEVRRREEDRGLKVPQAVTDGLVTYVRNIPGIKKSHADGIIGGQPQEKIPQTVLDQHGYRSMQLVPVLSMLSDDYGHIFQVEQTDIDMWDIVANRRILTCLLPSLEKSPSSLSSLGKIVLASLRTALGMALGYQTAGDVEQLKRAKPLLGQEPFKVFLDEIGYYFVEGTAITAAQARGLGFSFVYGAQDLPALQKNNKEEAGSVIGNTGTKIIGKIEDPETTLDMVSKRAGHEYRAEIKGVEKEHGTFGSRYTPNKNIQYEKHQSVTVSDLSGLKDGRWLCLSGPNKFYYRSLFTGGVSVPKTQHNIFIEVHGPDQETVEQLTVEVEEAEENFEKLLAGDTDADELQKLEEVEVIAAGARVARKEGLTPFESMLVGIERQHQKAEKQFEEINKRLKSAAADAAGETQLAPEPEVIDICTTPRQKTEEPSSTEEEPFSDEDKLRRSLEKLKKYQRGQADAVDEEEKGDESSGESEKSSDERELSSNEIVTAARNMTEHPAPPYPTKDKGKVVEVLTELLKAAKGS